MATHSENFANGPACLMLTFELLFRACVILFSRARRVLGACFGRVSIFQKFQTHRPHDAIIRLLAIPLRSSLRVDFSFLLRVPPVPSRPVSHPASAQSPARWRCGLSLPRHRGPTRNGVGAHPRCPREVRPQPRERSASSRCEHAPATHPIRHLSRHAVFLSPRRPEASRDRRGGGARDRDQARPRRARGRTWHADVARYENALNPPSEATRPPPRRSPSSRDIFRTVVVFPPYPHCGAGRPRDAIRPARGYHPRKPLASRLAGAHCRGII